MTGTNAQISKISGMVIDSNHQPIAFASIQIEGNSDGTISDETGNFHLKIKDSRSLTLLIKALGYKMSRQVINVDTKNLNIILYPDINQLVEILIFPDSSLKVLLSKAYKKIEENFPKTNIELTGFYRAFHKLVKDDRFLDFTEATLKVQESGYSKSSQDAQVEVLKVRNLIFPYRDSIDKVRYFGGAFMANWNDAVKMREPFLNPDFFNKKFSYNLESIQANNLDSIYVIRFKSKSKSEAKEGTIWIDKKSISYRRIEWQDNDPKNLNPLIPTKRIIRKFLCLYQDLEGLNTLKYTSVKGTNFNNKTQKEIEYAIEFATISFNLKDDYKPISIEKRLRYGAQFTEIESSKNVDFADQYTNLERDSIFTKEALNEDNRQIILDNFVKSDIPGKFKDKLRKLTNRLSFGYALNAFSYKKLNDEPLSLQYPGQINSSSLNITNFKIIPTYTFTVGYKMKPKMEIRVDFTEKFLKANLLKLTTAGFYRYFLIKRIGNPLFITTSLGLSIGKAGILAGEISSSDHFKIGDKEIKGETKVYLGDRQVSGQFGLGLEFRKKRLCYFTEFKFVSTIYHKNILYFQSKQNVFFSKNRVEDYPSKDISINPTNVYHGIMPVSMSFGIRYGI